MANTLKFGNGEWYGKKDTILAYNDENSNYKPLPFEFSRASSATVVNKAGLIETVGSGEPRIDFKDDAKGALLLEPQRSNLIGYSEDFSNASWVQGNTTITSDSLISPNGSLNASTLTDNTANTIHRLRDSVSLSASTDYSLSIFAKKGTLSNIQLALIDTTNSNTASRVFDLENGILGEDITSGGTLSDSKITDYGNGWYRCEITAQLPSTPNTYQITLATKSIGNSTTGNQVTYQGDGTSGIYIYGAQLEQSYPTSYIPTSGSAVTRVADACNNGGNEQVINSTEGVLMAEISALAEGGGNREVTLSDGTTSNRLIVQYRDSSNIRIILAKSTGDEFDTGVIPFNTIEKNKIAIKYKTNDFAFWVNGIEIYSDNTGNTFSANTLSQINFDGGTGGNDFYGNVKDLRVYNTALTDNELQKLTAI